MIQTLLLNLFRKMCRFINTNHLENKGLALMFMNLSQQFYFNLDLPDLPHFVEGPTTAIWCFYNQQKFQRLPIGVSTKCRSSSDCHLVFLQIIFVQYCGFGPSTNCRSSKVCHLVYSQFFKCLKLVFWSFRKLQKFQSLQLGVFAIFKMHIICVLELPQIADDPKSANWCFRTFFEAQIQSFGAFAIFLGFKKQCL